MEVQSLFLSDGRRFAWEDAGDPAGVPILYCHGTPGSRLQRKVFLHEEMLRLAGVRVITPDRPGCGASDFHSGRSIADWPRDVEHLVGHLGLKSFAVLGFSAGTPYAIALASSPLPVSAFGIVSGDAPPGKVPGAKPGLPATANRSPLATAAVLQLIRFTARVFPSITADIGTRMLSEPDRKVVADPVIRQRFTEMLRDALRQGPQGAVLDLQLAARDWRVTRPQWRIPVHIWHGGADVDSPVANAIHLARVLPGSRVHMFPGEGHVSVFVHHAEEIVDMLAAFSAGQVRLAG